LLYFIDNEFYVCLWQKNNGWSKSTAANRNSSIDNYQAFPACPVKGQCQNIFYSIENMIF